MTMMGRGRLIGTGNLVSDDNGEAVTWVLDDNILSNSFYLLLPYFNRSNTTANQISYPVLNKSPEDILGFRIVCTNGMVEVSDIWIPWGLWPSEGRYSTVTIAQLVVPSMRMNRSTRLQVLVTEIDLNGVLYYALSVIGIGDIISNTDIQFSIYEVPAGFSGSQTDARETDSSESSYLLNAFPRILVPADTFAAMMDPSIDESMYIHSGWTAEVRTKDIRYPRTDNTGGIIVFRDGPQPIPGDMSTLTESVQMLMETVTALTTRVENLEVFHP